MTQNKKGFSNFSIPLKLILLVSFIIIEPILPVKAFWWSNFSYQFLLWLLLLGLFNWSERSLRERAVIAGIICAVFFRPGICGLTFPWSNSIYLVLISGIFLISFFGKKDFMWVRTPLDVPVISFLILASGYMLFSLNREAGLRQLISLWGAGIFYFIIVRDIRDSDIVRTMLLVFFMSALRIMANGLYQFWIGLGETKLWIETYTQGELGERLLGRISCGRVFSSFVYPNAYAAFLIMLIPVVFFCILQVKGNKRIGLLSFLGLSFYSLYITYSKGGWLSLALTALIAFFFLFPGIRTVRKLSIIFLAVILVFFLVMALESTGSGKLGFTDSFKARWEYWQASLLMIRDNPFRGYGLGNFGEIYAQYKLPEAEETQLAHNNYLQVWVEMGFGGFLILLWIVFSFFRLGIFPRGDMHASSLSRGAFWGGVAFFIHSLVDFDSYVPNLLFCAFFLIGIVGALNAKTDEHVLLKNPRPKQLYYFFAMTIFLGILYSQTRYLNYIMAVDRVKSLAGAGRFDMADEEIDMLLDVSKFNPMLHFEKGRLNEIMAFKKKRKADFTRAIYEYSLASTLNPHRAGYHFRLGMLYWALREDPIYFKKAVSEFRLAHEAYPVKKEYKKLYESLKIYER